MVGRMVNIATVFSPLSLRSAPVQVVIEPEPISTIRKTTVGPLPSWPRPTPLPELHLAAAPTRVPSLDEQREAKRALHHAIYFDMLAGYEDALRAGRAFDVLRGERDDPANATTADCDRMLADLVRLGVLRWVLSTNAVGYQLVPPVDSGGASSAASENERVHTLAASPSECLRTF